MTFWVSLASIMSLGSLVGSLVLALADLTSSPLLTASLRSTALVTVVDVVHLLTWLFKT